MSKIKQICTDMAKVRHIMTFSDIAQSLTKGAVLGQKLNQPLAGAVLNLSLDASKRALLISEELIAELTKEASNPKDSSALKSSPKTKK